MSGQHRRTIWKLLPFRTPLIVFLWLSVWPSRRSNCETCAAHHMYDFHYVTMLPADRSRFPDVPPWTFVGNVSTTVRRICVIKLSNNTLVYPPVLNATVEQLALSANTDSVLFNTTIERNEGLYVICMTGSDSCKTCVFIQAFYFLAFTLQDFTVMSQKRSQTWIEFEYATVWDLPFPIYARTSVFVLDKSSNPLAAEASIKSLQNEKTIPLIDRYSFVNMTDLTPGQLYLVQANVSLNLDIPYQYGVENGKIRLPRWAYRRFYAATLPDYTSEATAEVSHTPNHATAINSLKFSTVGEAPHTVLCLSIMCAFNYLYYL